MNTATFGLARRNVLGVDPSMSFVNTLGRPMPALDHGRVIEELF